MTHQKRICKEENYIIIDCRKSELELIKNSILNSKLSELYNLCNIDWSKAEYSAFTNKIKETCSLWNKQIYTIDEITEIMKLKSNTIKIYLRKGTKHNWCNYITRKKSS